MATKKDITVICMHCKKWLRGPKPTKNTKHLSHGLCPECDKKYYSDEELAKVKAKLNKESTMPTARELIEAAMNEEKVEKPLTEGGYQGYANWETWHLILSIDNDQGLQEHAMDLAKAALTDNAGDKAAAITSVKTSLEDLVRGQMPETTPGTFFDAVLGMAMSKIDWQEVASSYVDEAADSASE